MIQETFCIPLVPAAASTLAPRTYRFRVLVAQFTRPPLTHPVILTTFPY